MPRTRTKPVAANPLILAIDDDLSLTATIEFALQHHGYRVITAIDGLAGLRAGRFHRPDLVILDLMLPRVHGIEVCRRLRTWTSIPIMVLTAIGAEDDLLTAFEAGADDYLTKPFRMRELLARVEALLRRFDTSRLCPESLIAGELTIDVAAHQAHFGRRELHLPPKEFQILATLTRQAGKAFTRTELISLVWGDDVIVDPRNVNVHIRWLREALAGNAGDGDGSHLIETVHGVGYRFGGQLGPVSEPEERLASAEESPSIGSLR